MLQLWGALPLWQPVSSGSALASQHTAAAARDRKAQGLLRGDSGLQAMGDICTVAELASCLDTQRPQIKTWSRGATPAVALPTP